MVEKIDTDFFTKYLTRADKEPSDALLRSKNTIIFGKLINQGFDWGRNDWSSYSMSAAAIAVVRPRVNMKIEDQYFYREIGTPVPARFKLFMKRNINREMARLGPLYDAVADGFKLQIKDFVDTRDRLLNSEFPQSQLDYDEEDYASSAAARLVTVSSNYGLIDILDRFNGFDELDQQVVDGVANCFSNLYSFNY